MLSLLHLRHRLLRGPFAAPAARRLDAVRVGVVGLTEAAVSALDQALRLANAQAPLRFKLHEGRGEVTLVDADLAADLDPQEWRTLFAGRPAVAVVAPDRVFGPLATPYRVSSAFDDGELLSTLNSIPEVGRRGAPRSRLQPPDTTLLAAASPFVAELLGRRGDRAAPCLLAGYGPGRSMLVDFASGEVIADPQAWEQLRARRELPRLADAGYRPSDVSSQARAHRIEVLVWAAGLAAGPLPLLGAPNRWRHAPLAARGWLHLPQFSRAPAHLHLAERMGRSPITPAELRRTCHVDERELRAFIQAGLFLQLFHWLR